MSGREDTGVAIAVPEGVGVDELVARLEDEVEGDEEEADASE